MSDSPDAGPPAEWPEGDLVEDRLTSVLLQLDQGAALPTLLKQFPDLAGKISEYLALVAEFKAAAGQTPDARPGSLPRRWAGFDLVAKIGEGAWGEVYRARSVGFRVPEVAIKILKPGRSI